MMRASVNLRVGSNIVFYNIYLGQTSGPNIEKTNLKPAFVQQNKKYIYKSFKITEFRTHELGST